MNLLMLVYLITVANEDAGANANGNTMLTLTHPQTTMRSPFYFAKAAKNGGQTG